ncbi:MAG: hypothetical protein K8R59_18600 [Thermoanaerobaculales bacterium]|nr:hypothetical protein [Thermoanaerobaculales bacterium]
MNLGSVKVTLILVVSTGEQGFDTSQPKIFSGSLTDVVRILSEISSSWRSLGPGSFAHADGRIRTYLEAGEILRLFPDWDVIHHWEGLGP